MSTMSRRLSNMSKRRLALFMGESSPLISPASQVFSSQNTTPTLISEFSDLELLTSARYTPPVKTSKIDKMKCAEVFDKGFEPEYATDEEVSATTTPTEATIPGPAVFGPALPPPSVPSDRNSGSSGFSSQSKLVEKFLGPERQLMNAENHNVELKAALQRALDGKKAAEEIIARQREENPAIDTEIKIQELKAALDVAIAARKAADKVASRKAKECTDLVAKHVDAMKAEKQKYYDHMNHMGQEYIVEERRYQDQIHMLEMTVREVTSKANKWKETALDYKEEVRQTEELFEVEINEIVDNHQSAMKDLKESHQKAIEAITKDNQTQTEAQKTNGTPATVDLSKENDALIGVLVRKHEAEFATLKESHEKAVEALTQDHETIVEELKKHHEYEIEALTAKYDKCHDMEHAYVKQYQQDTDEERAALKSEYNKKLRGIKQDYDLKLQAMKLNFETQSQANPASKLQFENTAPGKMGRSKSANAIGTSELVSPTRQGRMASSVTMSKLDSSSPGKMSRATSKNSLGSPVDADAVYKEVRDDVLARLERKEAPRHVDALGMYIDDDEEDEETEIERAAKDWVWTDEDQHNYDRDMKILNDAYPRLCAEALVRRDEQEAKEPGSTRDWIVPEFEEGVPFIPNGQRFMGLRWFNMMPLGRSPHLQ